MTRVDEFLFMNSLKRLKGICSIAFMEPEAKEAALAEVEAMLKIIDQDSSKKAD